MSNAPNTYLEFVDPIGSHIRVAINEGGFAFANDSVHILMGMRFGNDRTRMMRIGEDGRHHFEDVESHQTTGATMEIPRDFAIALLNALLRHFEGASDMHTVRADLLHERGRVDKMMDH